MHVQYVCIYMLVCMCVYVCLYAYMCMYICMYTKNSKFVLQKLKAREVSNFITFVTKYNTTRMGVDWEGVGNGR